MPGYLRKKSKSRLWLLLTLTLHFLVLRPVTKCCWFSLSIANQFFPLLIYCESFNPSQLISCLDYYVTALTDVPAPSHRKIVSILICLWSVSLLVALDSDHQYFLYVLAHRKVVPITLDCYYLFENESPQPVFKVLWDVSPFSSPATRFFLY